METPSSEGMGKYVVFVGREPGIYKTWAEVHRQVYCYPGNIHEKYSTCDAAASAWMKFLAKESMRKFPRTTARELGHVYWEGDLHFRPSSSTITPSAASMCPTLSEAVKDGVCEPLKGCGVEKKRDGGAIKWLWITMCCVLFVYLVMSSTNPGKMPNDEPSFNTPLNGGEGSLDTLTDEARVEPLHQTQLSSDVKQLTATVMDLAGSVKAAMVKFQQVDHRLEEFHQIQTVMHGNMERVDKFLSMVDKPNLGESTPKCGIKSKAPAESAACKKKRKNARATSEILKNDVINIDLDFEKNEGEEKNTDSAGSNPSKGILTPWLQKSFRSATSVEGLVGAFVRQEVEQTRSRLFVTPPSSKRATSSSSTFRSPITGPQSINPMTQAMLYMRPLPRPLVPKVYYGFCIANIASARPKFEVPEELDLLLTDTQVATYLFEEESDPEYVE
ncbi:uncharacterized protein LOC130719786 [Lotus japonicus]|uniref:uncharacterized protein LOC130719786 n=1 Tax=Lotus japonicus TaxID=34305 RepID=UPI002590E7CF|nr:uncharacterized protein LOC130719786 [Lotus japonicus]